MVFIVLTSEERRQLEKQNEPMRKPQKYNGLVCRMPGLDMDRLQLAEKLLPWSEDDKVCLQTPIWFSVGSTKKGNAKGH